MVRFLLTALAVVGVLVVIPGPAAADDLEPGATYDDVACTPAAQCCAICDKGQACGNSCISAKKTCNKGRGCSCNARDVCGQ